MYPDFCHCVSTPRAFIQLFNSASVVDLTLPRRDIGLPFQEPRLMRGPVELIQYLPTPQPSPAGLTTANRMFPICAPLKCQNSGTPEFWWSIFFASKFSCEKDGLHQSRMFPTLAILNAPKSGTPDFGVKPGNDGGNRINFIRSCSNLHIIGAG